jgi:transcriptional regulator
MADATKGHLDLLLLAVLSGGGHHGYAVITALRERSAGAFDLAEGSVYPALHRLENTGLLRSEWQPAAGRRRRIYHLTDAGRAALRAQHREWHTLTSAIEAVLSATAAAPA